MEMGSGARGVSVDESVTLLVAVKEVHVVFRYGIGKRSVTIAY